MSGSSIFPELSKLSASHTVLVMASYPSSVIASDHTILPCNPVSGSRQACQTLYTAGDTGRVGVDELGGRDRKEDGGENHCWCRNLELLDSGVCIVVFLLNSYFVGGNSFKLKGY